MKNNINTYFRLVLLTLAFTVFGVKAQTTSGNFTYFNNETKEDAPNLTAIGNEGFIWYPHANSSQALPTGTFNGNKFNGYYDVVDDDNRQHMLYVLFTKSSIAAKGDLNYSLDFNGANCVVAFKVGDFTPKITVYGWGNDADTRKLAIKKGDSYSTATLIAEIGLNNTNSEHTEWTPESSDITGNATYWIENTGSKSTYFAGVKVEAQEIPTATDLELIPTMKNSTECYTEYLWYANGTLTCDVDNYLNSKQVFYSSSASSLTPSASADVYVNGDNIQSYTIAAGDALGFKLRNKNASSSTKYRIRIFSNSNATNLLKTGVDVSSATPVAGGYTQQMKSPLTNEAVNTWLLTYDFSISADEVYWIKPAADTKIGGFEVLIDDTSSAFPGVQPYNLLDPTYWWIQDNSGNYVKANGGSPVGGSGALSRSFSNHVTVTGPSMPFNVLTDFDNRKTVMMNDKNGLAFRLAPGMSVSVTAFGDDGDGLVAFTSNDFGTRTNQLATSSNSGGSSTLTYTNSTTAYVPVWVSSKNQNYVYVSGMTFTMPTSVSGLAAINSNYLWYYNGGDGIYSAGLSIDGKTYRNFSDNILRDADKNVDINGATIKGNNNNASNPEKSGSYIMKYDDAKKNYDALAFKLAANNTYRVRIFTYEAVTNPLRLGDGLSAAIAATAPTPTFVQSLGDHTKLYNYDITVGSTDQVCWLFSESQWYLGGFEILPFDNTAPSLTAFTGNQWIANADANVQVRTSDSGNGDAYTFRLLNPGAHDVYVYGPAMPIDAYQVADNSSVMINSGNALVVKVQKGVKLSIPYFNTTPFSGNLVIKKGTDPSSLTQVYTSSGNTSPAEYTATDNEETLWITGADVNPLMVSVINFEQTGKKVDNAIEDNYVWFIVNDTPVAANGYTDAGQKTINIGAAMTPGSPTVWIETRTTQTVDLTNNALGFKVKVGKKGAIQIFAQHSDTRNVTLKTGEFYELSTAIANTDATDAGQLEYYQLDDVTDIYSYYFDLTSAAEDQTFWITSTGRIGGFEVMMDNAVYTPRSLSLVDGRQSSWGSGGSECNSGAITNALNASEAFDAVKSQYNHALIGATRLTPVLPNGKRTIMINTHNRVAFKLPTNAKTLKVHYYAPANTGIRLCKNDSGTPLGGWGGDGQMSGAGSLAEYKDADGDRIVATIDLTQYGAISADDVFWVSGIDQKYAFLYSIELAEVDMDVITAYHIFPKPGTTAPAKLNNGKYYDDYYMYYTGDNSAYSGTNTTQVLGRDMGAYAWEDGKDHITFAIGHGTVDGQKMKGHIRVYYNGVANPAAREDVSLENLVAGWEATYNAATHTIQFGEVSWASGKGWWFGNNPKDITPYTDFNVVLSEPSATSFRIVAQDVNGVSISNDYPAGTSVINLDLKQTNDPVYYTNDNNQYTDADGNLVDEDHKVVKIPAGSFQHDKVSQIYIQIMTATNGGTALPAEDRQLHLSEAFFVSIPMELRQGANTGDPIGTATTSLVQGTYIFDYPFDFTTATSDQQFWVNGTMNLGAIEVVFDDDKHVKVVNWYVNKDTKLIVGSQDPHWLGKDANGADLGEYPSGYDEYATFYVSARRRASLSFDMPQASRDLDNWELAVADANLTEAQVGEKYEIDESGHSGIKNSYGKHTIKVTDHSDNAKASGLSITYDRNGQFNTKNNIGSKTALYYWYSTDLQVPQMKSLSEPFDYSNFTNSNRVEWVGVTATQYENGKSESNGTSGIADLEGGTNNGVWKMYFRFVYYKAPDWGTSDIADITDDDDVKIGEEITVNAGQNATTSPIYYTVDSSEPENLADTNVDVAHSSTKTYSSAVDVKQNCMFKAAQYVETLYDFYVDCIDGPESAVSKVFKVVSTDHAVEFRKDNVVYVRDKEVNNNNIYDYSTGNGNLLVQRRGGYTMTIPTNGTLADNKAKWREYYNSNPYMYLMFGGNATKFFRTLGPASSSSTWNFTDGGLKWKASNDGGLTTYLDSYQNKFDPQSYASGYNNNPYTECNSGPGGATTENGGMFLQPISGAFLRFEPEYDGVITVWLRQNGSIDHSSQEVGEITRRPTYVMDENGRIMRLSAVKPTQDHHLGISGVYAANSGSSELRSTFEHTWQYGTAKKLYPQFDSAFPDRWKVENGESNFMIDPDQINDYRSSYLMYGWWYDGLDIDATVSDMASAKFASRFEWTGTHPLYRDDEVYKMEVGTGKGQLGLNNYFAKYGFEVPNFTYVRYRIPVKAGKTYYIAGRGTKNGFTACEFEPLPANYNYNVASGNKKTIDNYRFKDNPDISFNSDARPVVSWTNADARTNPSEYDATAFAAAINSYSSISTITIDGNSASNTSNLTNSSNTGINDITLSQYDIDGNGNVYGKTVNVTLNRTFTAGYWHPIILPFSLSETRLQQYFGEGTQVLYLDPAAHTFGNETDESTGDSWRSAIRPAIALSQLTFTSHRYQMLYANTPAFIRPTFTWTAKPTAPADIKPAKYADSPVINTVDQDALKQASTHTANRPIGTDISTDATKVKYASVSSITFKRVTIDGSNRSNGTYSHMGYAIGGGYEIVGTYEAVQTSGDTYYISNIITPETVNVNGNNYNVNTHLYHSKDGGINMRATRVWIRPIAGTFPAPIRTVAASDFTDEELDLGQEAGINDVVADENPIEMYNDDNVYDTLGRVVGYGSTEGLPQGVYIFQGRKVYIR